MKTGSIFSFRTFSRGDVYGIHPRWQGGRGETLGVCPFSMTETDNVDLITDDDEACFAERDLQGAQLVGVHLEGADFRKARLARANLERSVLRLTNFTGADLTEARLAHSDLTYADLVMTTLLGADLRHADLCKVNLSAALLRGADLSHADLEFAILTETDLRGANLTGVDLRAARLHGAFIDEETRLPFSMEEAVASGMCFKPRGEGANDSATSALNGDGRAGGTDV